jgi:hypothetical protein
MAFALHLPDTFAAAIIAGADDASDAGWFAVDGLPQLLAFDHLRILKDGLAVLKSNLNK